mmetsp:Transcript_16880/g.39261  ORF Transcript_16880/g.39261 Transcript_16880/m.39261 type:complete len:366 (+) Transcript_16880:49-1146(+)
MAPNVTFLAWVGAVACLTLSCQAHPVCIGNTTAADILSTEDFSHKVALVTGGDSGLGYEISLALAGRQATVVIATHNETKGNAAAQRIRASTGADVRSMPLDLSSLASVRAFAKNFTANFGSRLHLLINNAGIAGPSAMSSDGYELVFEVDYLGHFLLTELLLPALRESAPARVVNTASGAHENACETAGWPADCFKDWTYLPPPVVPLRNVTVHYRTGNVTLSSSSYGIAKFANVQHAVALAKREAANGVEAFSLTPGFASTSMTGHMKPDDPRVKAFCQGQIHPDPSLPVNPCPFTAAEGAAVIAHASVGSTPSGSYLSRTWACGERPIVPQGFTAEMVDEFYDLSLKLVGVSERADLSVVLV